MQQKRYFATISICLLAAALAAQSLKSFEKAGDRAFQKKDFSAALEYFKIVLDADDDNLAARWKYAEAATHFFAWDLAEENFQKIEASKSGAEKFPLLFLRLGEVKKSLGEYDEAIAYFEKFAEQNIRYNASPTENQNWEIASREIENCREAQRIVAAKTEVKITHLGKEINSPFSDFGAFQRGDTLFFSSYRFDQKKSAALPRPKLTKMMSSLGGKRAREVGNSFPAPDSAHSANGAMTRDGRFFFFNFCKTVEKTGDIRCQIYLSVKTKRGRWSNPQPLPAPVNLAGSTSTQPTVAYFSEKKSPVLIFSSDREGGAGATDLYSVELDSMWFCPCHADKFGTKKDPKLPAAALTNFQNLKNLNTAGDDATPFFHSESQTLFFSNDTRAGLGGFDIFQSKFEKQEFSAPENVGFGVNSSFNDVYPFVGRDGRTGYFSSNRPGVFFLDEKNKACCNDIFAFQIPEPKPPTDPEKPETPPTEITKIPPPEPTDPSVGSSINLLPTNPVAPSLGERAPTPPLVFEPPKLRDFVGLPLYFDNDEPDKRTRRTTTKKTYEETVLTYLERQDEYRERFSQGLRSEKKEAAEVAIEQFFEEEIRRGFERLGQLSELIFNRLQEGETVEVIIKGFTSPRAESDYNLQLGRRRISSVRNFFAGWSEGVLQPFIERGALKISETSFGETTARSGISDDLRDERNSIFSPDAARERRVEIVEIKN